MSLSQVSWRHKKSSFGKWVKMLWPSSIFCFPLSVLDETEDFLCLVGPDKMPFIEFWKKNWSMTILWPISKDLVAGSGKLFILAKSSAGRQILAEQIVYVFSLVTSVRLFLLLLTLILPIDKLERLSVIDGGIKDLSIDKT